MPNADAHSANLQVLFAVWWIFLDGYQSASSTWRCGALAPQNCRLHRHPFDPRHGASTATFVADGVFVDEGGNRTVDNALEEQAPLSSATLPRIARPIAMRLHLCRRPPRRCWFYSCAHWRSFELPALLSSCPCGIEVYFSAIYGAIRAYRSRVGSASAYSKPLLVPISAFRIISARAVSIRGARYAAVTGEN